MTWTPEELSDYAVSTRSLALPGAKNNTALRSLQKTLNDPYARLHSIALDSDYVSSLVEQIGLPVVGNERCGTWYIDPESPAVITERAYFKSTDGHVGQWSFNLRRGNLQLVRVIVEHSGLVIVDSTRRGKSFPDALSKTVPIWCCVLNRAAAQLFGHQGQEWSDLVLPDMIPPSERWQIEERLPGFVESLLASSYPLKDILAPLSKPLCPVHASPQHTLPLLSSSYNNVICLSASRCPFPDAPLERDYVQGAADDHEGWSAGLTPQLFWRNRVELLGCKREEFKDKVQEVLARQKETGQGEGKMYTLDGLQFSLEPQADAWLSRHPESSLSVPKTFKKVQDGQNFLIALESMLKGKTMVAFDDTLERAEGQDWVVASLLILFSRAQAEPITKASLAGQLHRIVDTTNGQCNPSRSILKRVNQYLIDRPGQHA